jgi:queuine tRNA-ribosyltransferase
MRKAHKPCLRGSTKESADFVVNNNFSGQAIGESLSGTKSQMHETVEMISRHIDRSLPIHLLGICRIPDIWHGVKNGIDTFDCVYPTRLARHGGGPYANRFRMGEKNL